MRKTFFLLVVVPLLTASYLYVRKKSGMHSPRETVRKAPSANADGVDYSGRDLRSATFCVVPSLKIFAFAAAGSTTFMVAATLCVQPYIGTNMVNFAYVLSAIFLSLGNGILAFVGAMSITKSTYLLGLILPLQMAMLMFSHGGSISYYHSIVLTAIFACTSLLAGCSLAVGPVRRALKTSEIFVAKNSNFDASNLNGVSLAASIIANSSFIRANLTESNLCAATIVDCDLSRAVFIRARLTGLQVSGTSFSEAEMTHCHGSPAFIEGSDFTGANLVGSSFGTAVLRYCNFSGANLSDVNFSRARFSHVDFTDALESDRTKWPSGFDKAAAGVRQAKRAIG